MTETQALRRLFLLEFTRALIENSRPPEIKETKKSIIPKIEQLMPSRPITSSQIPINTSQIPILLSRQRVPIRVERIESQFNRKVLQDNRPILKSVDTNNQFETSMMNSSQPIQNKLEKIKPFLNDPSVSSIECSGPEKQLIINKQGLVQTTNISLNQSEISAIVEEVSNKTRIPLVSGTFKAAFDNFIMTAVISEFVGTRFLIQRKMPNMPPNYGNLPPRPTQFQPPQLFQPPKSFQQQKQFQPPRPSGLEPPRPSK